MFHDEDDSCIDRTRTVSNTREVVHDHCFNFSGDVHKANEKDNKKICLLNLLGSSQLIVENVAGFLKRLLGKKINPIK